MILVRSSPRLRSFAAFALEGLVASIAMLAWGAQVERHLPFDTLGDNLIIMAVGAGCFAGYRILTPLWMAGTPAQRLLRVRMVRRDGERLTARDTAVRFAMQVVEGGALMIGGPITMIALLVFHAKKGDWPHDRVAGTTTVASAAAPPPRRPPGPARF